MSAPDEKLRRIGWDVTARGCWEFLGSRRQDGYGRVKIAGRTIRAHRLAHEAWVGPIPEGAVVMHSCDNPPCINPEHLSVGTVADNDHDRDRKGRGNNARGEHHGRARLDWGKVREIRLLAGTKSLSELSRQYGVSRETVNKVIHMKTWHEPQEVGAI